jgi:hypothetical protein
MNKQKKIKKKDEEHQQLLVRMNKGEKKIAAIFKDELKGSARRSKVEE